MTCSGCGAFAQTTASQQLGYFDLRSKRVRQWLQPRESNPRGIDAAEDEVVHRALKSFAPEKLQKLGLSTDALIGGEYGRAMAGMWTSGATSTTWEEQQQQQQD